MYKSILYCKHSITPTCLDHSSGHYQKGVLWRMDVIRQYKNLWTNAQM